MRVVFLLAVVCSSTCVRADSTENATAFAKLASGKPLAIYQAYEHLKEAGKKDTAVSKRLAKMMWDRRFNETTRLWSLRTLAEIGSNAKVVLPDLVKAMNDADPFFRAYGALAVIRTSKDRAKPVAVLKALTTHKNAYVRQVGFEVIGEAGPAAKDLVPLLLRVMADEKSRQRQDAVEAIGGMGAAAKDGVPILEKLINHKEKRLRNAAVLALCRLATRLPSATKPLTQVMSRKGYAGYQVSEVLARAGKPMVPTLIKLLESDNEFARGNAAHSLRFMGRTAAPAAKALAAAIPRFKQSLGRDNAITALGMIGRPGLPYLIALIKKARAGNRYEYAKAISLIGPDAKAAAPVLFEIIKNDRAGSLDCSKAGDALAKLGPHAAPLIPGLIELLNNEKATDKARIAAAKTLGAIGPAAKDAVNPLIATIKPDRFNRYTRYAVEAAGALGKIGKPAKPAVPVLIKMLSAESYYSSNAIVALGRLGPVAKPALAPLRKMFKTGKKRTQIICAVAVTRIDSESTDGVKLMVDMLSSGRNGKYDTMAICKALADIGPRAKPAIKQLRTLVDNKTETSARAALAIYRINNSDAAALKSLIATLSRENSSAVTAAIDCLRQIGPAAKAAIPDLRRIALYNRGYYDRDKSRFAIRAIDPDQEP